MSETHRKLFHMAFGAALAIGIFILGKDDGLMALFAMLAAGLPIIHWKMTGNEDGFVDLFLFHMERRVVVPGTGALMFVVGAILALAFSSQVQHAVAVLMMFALGDGASTIVGLRGTHQIFYNRRKTWEGTVTFFVAAACGGFPLLGFGGLPLAALLALTESLPLPVDDNIAIPTAGAIASYFLAK
jgi:dolichol kinase